MLRSIIGTLVVVMLAVGCSGSKVLEKSEVEQGAMDALTETVGQAPDSVTCPDDLDAEVGASERCTLTADGEELGMTVTVTSVDGDTATFDVEVDE